MTGNDRPNAGPPLEGYPPPAPGPCIACGVPIDPDAWDGFVLVHHNRFGPGPICNHCAADEPSIGKNPHR